MLDCSSSLRALSFAVLLPSENTIVGGLGIPEGEFALPREGLVDAEVEPVFTICYGNQIDRVTIGGVNIMHHTEELMYMNFESTGCWQGLNNAAVSEATPSWPLKPVSRLLPLWT